jgi:hypothetical protein
MFAHDPPGSDGGGAVVRIAVKTFRVPGRRQPLTLATPLHGGRYRAEYVTSWLRLAWG